MIHGFPSHAVEQAKSFGQCLRTWRYPSQSYIQILIGPMNQWVLTPVLSLTCEVSVSPMGRLAGEDFLDSQDRGIKISLFEPSNAIWNESDSSKRAETDCHPDECEISQIVMLVSSANLSGRWVISSRGRLCKGRTSEWQPANQHYTSQENKPLSMLRHEKYLPYLFQSLVFELPGVRLDKFVTILEIFSIRTHNWRHGRHGKRTKSTLISLRARAWKACSICSPNIRSGKPKMLCDFLGNTAISSGRPSFPTVSQTPRHLGLLV